MTPAPALVAVGLEIQRLTETGEELEADFENGLFINHTRGITREYPSLPDALREIVAIGGNTGWLKRWWQQQSALQRCCAIF